MDTLADWRARRPGEFPSASLRGGARGISARLRNNAVMTGLVPGPPPPCHPRRPAAESFQIDRKRSRVGGRNKPGHDEKGC